MKFNLICIQSHNERPSKLNIDKKLKLIQSEFENIQHHIYDTNITIKKIIIPIRSYWTIG